jgi:hypothetical protein
MSPPSSPPAARHVIDVAGISVALLLLTLIVVAAKWPMVLWHSSLGDSQIFIAAVGAVASTAVCLVFRRWHMAAHATLAILVTAAIYATLPAALYFGGHDAANRTALAIAKNWPILVDQDYEHPGFFLPEPYNSEFGEGRAEIQNGRLVLLAQSNRDFTYQAGVSRRPPTVGDFYFSARARLVAGPDDANCGLLFRWRDNEHWYAFKIFKDRYEITQNPGQLPHRILLGPSKLGPNSQQALKIEIFARGSLFQFFLNGHVVDERDIKDFEGQLWLEAQATRYASSLQCSFDDVLVRAPAVQ